VGRHSVVLLALAALVGALLVTACDSADDQAERRQALQALIDATRLEPEPGETAITISETSSKGDAPYYGADGTLPGGRATVGGIVERTLRDQGWDVLDSGAVDYSLGWQVRGVKGSMVARALVGWYDNPPGEFNPSPRLPARVWVAIHVGRRGSNQAWTKVD
jgi:hypothetical protein